VVYIPKGYASLAGGAGALVHHPRRKPINLRLDQSH
jgi:hypothetical protein